MSQSAHLRVSERNLFGRSMDLGEGVEPRSSKDTSLDNASFVQRVSEIIDHGEEGG